MSLPVRAIVILALAYTLAYVAFLYSAADAPGLEPALAGVYALDAIASFLLVRALLGLLFDFTKPVAFFRSFAGLTDPFIALARPVIPDGLEPGLKPFAAAFFVFAIRVLLFGGPSFLAAPPVWYVIAEATGSAAGLPEAAKHYLVFWAKSVGAL